MVTLHQRNSISYVRNSYLDNNFGGNLLYVATAYPQTQKQ